MLCLCYFSVGFVLYGFVCACRLDGKSMGITGWKGCVLLIARVHRTGPHEFARVVTAGRAKDVRCAHVRTDAQLRRVINTLDS